MKSSKVTDGRGVVSSTGKKNRANKSGKEAKNTQTYQIKKK